jgi:hypothetical protein
MSSQLPSAFLLAEANKAAEQETDQRVADSERASYKIDAFGHNVMKNCDDMRRGQRTGKAT